MSAALPEIITELRRIAGRLETLDPATIPTLWAAFDVQPARCEDNPSIITVVDAVGQALTGKSGNTIPIPGGHHYSTPREGTTVGICVYGALINPTETGNQP